MFRHRLAEWAGALVVAIALATPPLELSRANVGVPSRPLQLEVYINDAPTALIGSFVQLADGRIAAQRAEFLELGLKVQGANQGLNQADTLVALDGLAGVSYRFDEPEQKLYLTVGDEQRLTKVYDAHAVRDAAVTAQVDYGAVLNYSFFAATTQNFKKFTPGFSGANATLDARLFGPYGALSQSAIAGATTTRDADVLRLDTTWSYSDSDTLKTYRAGDMISGGLAWTRPIRLGGVQMQRNFGLRPDLVTLPLPAFSGSAAVPSTVDVYVNSLKTYSQQVATGPYQINNIPGLSGGGTARVVLRDSAGREVETSLPFYTTPRLLREGLMDFSVEAGVPRLNYGIDSHSYMGMFAGSGSVRRGVFDWLTLEAHGEGSARVLNGGLGAVTSLGSWGVLSLAASASRIDDAFAAFGYQVYAAYDTQFNRISLHASTRRSFGNYNDLASITAHSPVAAVSNPALAVPTGMRSAKSLNTVAIGLPLPFDRSSINFAGLRSVFDDGKTSELLSLSLSRSFSFGGAAYLTAFADLKDKKSSGVFLGFSMPLGSDISASTSVSRTRDGMNYTVEAMKSIRPEPGSYGWRVRDTEGKTPYRSASGTYRSSVAQIEGNVQQRGDNVIATAQASGAVATMAGGVFFANRIDDAFAVVNVGAPGVDVLHENRPAGKTNAQGQILIPGLASYQNTNIAIDPRGLPLDADAPVTQKVVTPPHFSGVVVNLDVKTKVDGAVVVFKGKDGSFIAPGSTGKLDGNDEPFVIGYDGRAYIKGLSPTNSIVVTHATGECRASFPYKPQEGSQVVIGPMVCQ